MPFPAWRSLYPYLVLAASSSTMPGLQFEASLQDMEQGAGVLPEVNIPRNSLRRAIKGLEMLRLISRSQEGSRKTVYAIQEINEGHHAELVLALNRIRRAGLQATFGSALQEAPDDAFWSDVAPAFRGERLGAVDLLDEAMTKQLDLFEEKHPVPTVGRRDLVCVPTMGTEDPVCVPTMGTGVPMVGTQTHAPSVLKDSRELVTKSRSVLRAHGGHLEPEEEDGSMQRRSKEEVAAHREETRKRKEAGIKAIRNGQMPTVLSAGGQGQPNRRGSSKVEEGTTKANRRPKKASVKIFTVTDLPSWDRVRGELERVFGEGVLDIWEDGSVHQNQDHELGQSAIKLLGLLVEGRKHAKWGRYPVSTDHLLTALRAYELWSTRFYGEAPQPNAGNVITQLLDRTRPKAVTGTKIEKAMEALAGIAITVVRCTAMETPQYLPDNLKWLSILSPNGWKRWSDAWAKATKTGLVKGTPEEFLNSLPFAQLTHITKEDAERLLLKPTPRFHAEKKFVYPFPES